MDGTSHARIASARRARRALAGCRPPRDRRALRAGFRNDYRSRSVRADRLRAPRRARVAGRKRAQPPGRRRRPVSHFRGAARPPAAHGQAARVLARARDRGCPRRRGDDRGRPAATDAHRARGAHGHRDAGGHGRASDRAGPDPRERRARRIGSDSRNPSGEPQGRARLRAGCVPPAALRRRR